MNQTITTYQLYFVAVFIGLAITACGGRNSTEKTQSDSLATYQPDTLERLLLIPGQSAGPFELGASDSLLYKRLGKPDFSNAGMGKAVLMWDTDTNTFYPLSVFTSRDMGNDETARIQQIRITSPYFETQEGIQIGDTLSKISATYPKLLRKVETYPGNGGTYTIYDTDEGIAFELDPADRCVAIIIHKAGVSIPTYEPLREQQ